MVGISWVNLICNEQAWLSYQKACEPPEHVRDGSEEKVLGSEGGEVVAGNVDNLGEQEAKDWSYQKRLPTIRIGPCGTNYNFSYGALVNDVTHLPTGFSGKGQCQMKVG